MKYMLIVAALISLLYIGMTELALGALNTIAPYYLHADEIAQHVVER